MDINQIYSSLVMEHSSNSPFKKEMENPSVSKHGHNPNCGDDITLFLKTKNNVIVDATFSGVGCAISQASTSIMIETILGKTIDEAKELAKTFTKMIDRQKVLEKDKKLLKNARAFENIKDMPARVKCALLPWKTLTISIEEIEKN